MDENLHYRRQFLLAKVPTNQLPSWRCLQISQYFLYVHPDLSISMKSYNQKDLIVIGEIYDSENTQLTNSEIINNIVVKIDTLQDFFLNIKQYAGSFILIFRCNSNLILLNDLLGTREVYYTTEENCVICGSQPNLLVKYSNPTLKPSLDPELLDFYMNHFKNCSWIGDNTYFENIKHLLPNHYFDINDRKIYRYWPNNYIKQYSLNDATEKISTFLKGTLKSIVNRQKCMMAVTSGFDSRTLLAASKDIKENIYYFVNKHENIDLNHPDISVPSRMFKCLVLPFHVHEIPKEVDNKFRKIFFQNTFLATERILPAIYNIYYKNHNDKVNILGTGEIGRTRFGKEPTKLTSHYIAYQFGYGKSPYAIKQSNLILSELLPVSKKYNINIMTLIHLEQNKANRWVVGNSESDIAIEEIDPFSSHLLFELFLGVDKKYTMHENNILFKSLIQNMWPDLLKWPINPPHKTLDTIKYFLKKIGFFSIIKKLKYQGSYYRYIISKF